MSNPAVSINSEGYELTEFSRTAASPTPAIVRPAQERPPPPPPARSAMQPAVSGSPVAGQYPQLPQAPDYRRDSQQLQAEERRPVEEMLIQCSVCRATLRYARGVPVVVCPCCRSCTATEQMFFLRCFRCGAGYYSQPGAQPFACRCGLVISIPTPEALQPPPAHQPTPQTQASPSPPTRPRLSTEQLASVSLRPS